MALPGKIDVSRCCALGRTFIRYPGNGAGTSADSPPVIDMTRLTDARAPYWDRDSEPDCKRVGTSAVLKVMTWNVENLFRSGETGGPSAEAVYAAKRKGLARAINDQMPDALALQEVGDPAALDDLVALLNGPWQRQVSAHPDVRGIRVAWLSPRPINDSSDIVTFAPGLQPFQVDDDGVALARMGRGALAVTIASDSGNPVRLITCHLKSKLLTFPGGRFNPRTEDERARYPTYPLNRRAGEAATPASR
jgi:hypothetical protein